MPSTLISNTKLRIYNKSCNKKNGNADREGGLFDPERLSLKPDEISGNKRY